MLSELEELPEIDELLELDRLFDCTLAGVESSPPLGVETFAGGVTTPDEMGGEGPTAGGATVVSSLP